MPYNALYSISVGSESAMLCIFLLLPFYANAFSCKDEANKPVDWWVVYKLPRVYGSKDNLLKYGSEYLYLDSKNTSWTISGYAIDDTKYGALPSTLNPLYEMMENPKTFYLMYNDAYPNGDVSFEVAHSKGVVAFDNANGFWLIHSVPKFPPNKEYSYPSSGKVYGQTMLCVTFNKTVLPEIAQQLFYTGPGVYSSRVSKDLKKEIPILESVLSRKLPTVQPFMRVALLKSAGGQTFQHFAKSKMWKSDLYHEFVAPEMNVDLLVESWRHNNKSNMPSNCTVQYYVENIERIKFTDSLHFDSKRDHSKWAVSDGDEGVTCIGDINRQSGQLRRGGGTLCTTSKPLWQRFRSSVQELEDCPVSTENLVQN